MFAVLCMQEGISHLESHKFIPLMYQLAARMSSKTSPFQEVLQQVRTCDAVGLELVRSGHNIHLGGTGTLQVAACTPVLRQEVLMKICSTHVVPNFVTSGYIP